MSFAGKTSFWAAVALVLCLASLQARVHENVKQCEDRFGSPIRDLPPVSPCDEARVYTKGGIVLVLGFIRGTCQYAFYSKGDDSAFSDLELGLLLAAESEGSEWRKTNAAPMNTKWERKDGGAWALYNPIAKSFTVTSKEWIAANDALTTSKERKSLDGF